MKQKILFLAANPTNETRLALDEECREIDEKLQGAEYRDLELITKWAIREDDLQQHLLRHSPHVVHFSGHGSDSEELILLDEAGQAQPISSDAIKGLFTTLKDNIQLVVLNACFSHSQAEAITEVIDCAVGMNHAIGDKAAIAFSAAFYRALGFGRSVKVAFELGKNALQNKKIREEHTPVLLVRKGVDPDRVFLVKTNITTNPR